MIDIVQAVAEYKAKKRKLWPVRSNRASQMGHPCERYLVYLRTRWEEQSLPDVGLQFIFDDGNLHEAGVLRDLQDAGFRIVEQQRVFEWKKYQITGSVDAKIIYHEYVFPIEVKSFSDFSWRAINSIEDMLKSKAIYMKGYPAQLTLYLIMDEKELGFFILKNKLNGLLKQIPLSLDFAYAESLIQKAERINTHVAGGTLPDRIAWEIGACENCSFGHICLPDHKHDATLLNDPELEVKLDRRGELKVLVDEYEDLDKEIRSFAKEKPEFVIGRWRLTGKWVEKKGYEVQASKYWQTQIKELKP